jgi:hypothetical protein
MTGLSRRRSRVRVPSLPLLTKPLVRRAKRASPAGGKPGGKRSRRASWVRRFFSRRTTYGTCSGGCPQSPLCCLTRRSRASRRTPFLTSSGRPSGRCTGGSRTPITTTSPPECCTSIGALHRLHVVTASEEVVGDEDLCRQADARGFGSASPVRPRRGWSTGIERHPGDRAPPRGSSATPHEGGIKPN